MCCLYFCVIGKWMKCLDLPYFINTVTYFLVQFINHSNKNGPYMNSVNSPFSHFSQFHMSQRRIGCKPKGQKWDGDMFL